nr:MAG TPA: RelB antitoxin [Ackermannviridae sp.]DAW58050.1 MAG TPA: RelB antitoxin [Ackermannviridae sp.]
MVGSGSPKDLFYAKCKEMGINPNTILSMLNMK